MNINPFNNRNSLKKYRRKIKLHYQRKFNQQLAELQHQAKMNIELLINQHILENKNKEEIFKKEVDETKKVERGKYIPQIEILKEENKKLQAIIDDRKQLSDALKQKEIRLTDAMSEIGGKLKRAEMKMGEAISAGGDAMKIAEDYDRKEKNLNKKLDEIRQEEDYV